jgi:gamma-glutamylputrescine oxidase
VRRHVGTDAYVGGMIDHSGGHMHPLNLALGEAAALESLGGRIFEGSRVVSVEYSGPEPVVRTDGGSVRAEHLIICGNAYLGDAVPALAPRILPVSTQIMATAPLSEARAAELLPTDICVEDCRYILDYFRLSADRRLLFGGGTVYGGKDAKDVIAKLTPNMLRIFPQLKGVAIEHAWNGNFALSFSRVPQMGKLADHTWFAHGYSGHGVTGSHLFGRILAEAVHGDLSRFDVFASLPWYPFPGGRRFGAQYSTLGSWYYGLRDRLGL